MYGVEDSYSPVLKATEVRLMTAIAAEHGCNIYKTDTKQAFLYGDLEEDEPMYIKPPDWWFEPVPEGHVLQLLKAVCLWYCAGSLSVAYEDIDLDRGQ